MWDRQRTHVGTHHISSATSAAPAMKSAPTAHPPPPAPPAPQVSAGYAEEIKTYLGGWGMEGLLTQRGPVLNGIVNGIDTE